MAHSHDDDDEGSKRNNSAVVRDTIDAVKAADSLADTPFASLFNVARTTSKQRASGVTLQVRVRDGEFEVHDRPVRTRQGEHLRGTDDWDWMISLSVRPLMPTKDAKPDIILSLRQIWQHEMVREERQEYHERSKEMSR